jgi:tetratricopeptide (TPR) repeat protein
VGESINRIRSSVEVEFQQVNQQLTNLQAGNEQAFTQLGSRLDSDFANVRELLAEIGVQLSQLLGITTTILGEQRKELEKLKKGQEEIKGKIAPPPPKLNLEDSLPSTQYWQGREEELETIEGWIKDSQILLVGIQGMGGVGKSTLAAKIYESFPPDKRFWADMRLPTASFSLLARRILQQLGGYTLEQIKSIAEPNFPNALVRLLQREHYLLVLDNLESLLQEDRNWQPGHEFYQQFFYNWLERGQNSQLLLTAREQPDLPAIHASWYVLEKGLKPTEGANLLQSLGIQGTQLELEGFSQSVGGFPLSLMLVAGLLLAEEADNPQITYLKNYGDLFQIQGLHGGQPQVSVEDVLQWSWQRLSPLQQSLLQRVSVYRLPFNSDAAGEEEGQLRQLEKRSLLVFEKRDENRKRCYHLPPAVREFIKRLEEDLTAAHQQAIAYYFSQAKPKESWQKIENVKEYLEIFYHWCQLGQYDTAFELIRQIENFLTLQGGYTVLVEAYSQLVTAWETVGTRDDLKYAASLTSLGNVYMSLGDYQQALAFYEQSLAIGKEIGYRGGEAGTLGNLGNVYNSLGDYQQALALYEQSLAIFRDIGHRGGEADNLNNLGSVYNSLGDYQQALAFYEQSLAIFRDIGDRGGEANSLNNLGSVYNSLGDYQQALAFYEQSLAINRDIGDRGGEAGTLNNLGSTYNSLGNYQQSITHCKQSLAIRKDIGDRLGEANSLSNLGGVCTSLENYPQAIEFEEQSLSIFEEINCSQGKVEALAGLGQAYRDLGEFQQAIEYYQQSLDIAQQINYRRGEVDAWYNLALTLENAQRETDALGAYRNAHSLYQAMTLNHKLQDCDTAIQRLSSPIFPPQRQTWWSRLKRWLRRLWCWFSGWWRR